MCGLFDVSVTESLPKSCSTKIRCDGLAACSSGFRDLGGGGVSAESGSAFVCTDGDVVGVGVRPACQSYSENPALKKNCAFG